MSDCVGGDMDCRIPYFEAKNAVNRAVLEALEAERFRFFRSDNGGPRIDQTDESKRLYSDRIKELDDVIARIRRREL